VNPLGLLFVAIGVFAMLGAICDWEWFMNSRKGRGMSKLLTRTGARILYTLIGLVLVILGTLGTLGVIDMTPK